MVLTVFRWNLNRALSVWTRVLVVFVGPDDLDCLDSGLVGPDLSLGAGPGISCYPRTLWVTTFPEGVWHKKHETLAGLECSSQLTWPQSLLMNLNGSTRLCWIIHGSAVSPASVSETPETIFRQRTRGSVQTPQVNQSVVENILELVGLSLWSFQTCCSVRASRDSDGRLQRDVLMLWTESQWRHNRSTHTLNWLQTAFLIKIQLKQLADRQKAHLQPRTYDRCGDRWEPEVTTGQQGGGGASRRIHDEVLTSQFMCQTAELFLTSNMWQ